MQRVQTHRDTQIILMSFAAFIGLGLTSGLLGLAWPTMRQKFGVDISAIGVLLVFQVIGSMTSSFFNARLAALLGTARTLMLGSLLIALGLFGTALAPVWPLLCASALVGGLGGGTLDARINTTISRRYGSRQMNWLHASFGVGWVLGTLMMTAVVAQGWAWELGYAVVGAVMLALVLMFTLTVSLWPANTPTVSQQTTDGQAGLRETLRQPLLWVSLALLFCYTGLEAMPNAWAYSVFTAARSMDAKTAGLSVTLFLASFTVGRVFFGFVGERIKPNTLIRVCMVAAVVGALVWWNPLGWGDLAGLLILGFAEAPLYPLLILGTADRVGARFVDESVGIEVSAAGAGIALVPAFGGVIVARLGLLAVLPFILVLALLVVGIFEVASIGQTRLSAARTAADRA